jgi:hypothetical protein
MAALRITEKPRGLAVGVGMMASNNNAAGRGAGVGMRGGVAAGRGGVAGRGARGGFQPGPVGRGRPPVPPKAAGPAGPSGPGAASAAAAAPGGLSMTWKKGEARTLVGDLPSGTPLVEGTDFQFGTSKLFIRKAHHFFSLEYDRTVALAQIVSRIAALWRAFAGKRAYKRIRAAWKRMQSLVRGKLLRLRFLRMKKAAIKIQAAARGHLVRCSPLVEDLREGLGMVSFHNKVRRRMSLRWERPPKSDWLGLLTPQGFPTESAARLMSVLRSKLSPPQAIEKIAYADHVLKVKDNYKVVRRALVVTEGFVLNLRDPWPKGTINRSFPIERIDHLSMSPYRDSYLGIHVTGEKAYVCICETKSSLVKALCERYKAITGKTLLVEVGERWTYSGIKPGDERTLAVNVVHDNTQFVAHAQAPAAWEALYNAPGGVGGRLTESLTAFAAAAASGRPDPHAEAHRPFHTLQADKTTLLVSVPVLPRPKLVDLLTDAEKTKLKAKGFRAVQKM